MAQANIRPLEMKDLDNIMSWINNKSIVSDFANIKRMSRESEQKFLEQILASATDKLFAIEDENGVYIGDIGVHQIDLAAGIGRLAIIIGNPAYHGRGYAQSAVKEMLKLMFEEYNFRKIWLMVKDNNQKGLHLYKKCGFKIEGLLKEGYYSNGKYYDMIKMAILKQDYKKMHGGGKNESIL